MKCPYCGCRMEKLSQNLHICYGDKALMVKKWVLINLEMESEELSVMIDIAKSLVKEGKTDD